MTRQSVIELLQHMLKEVEGASGDTWPEATYNKVWDELAHTAADTLEIAPPGDYEDNESEVGEIFEVEYTDEQATELESRFKPN